MLESSGEVPWSFTGLAVNHEVPSEGKTTWKFSHQLCASGRKLQKVLFISDFPPSSWMATNSG